MMSQKLNEVRKEESITVAVSNLDPVEHGEIVCYPKLEKKIFDSRITQMEQLGIKSVTLEGSTKIGRFGVLGRGCVSVVVKADLDSMLVALKIRRTDANRPNMLRDYDLQKSANSFGVGPIAYSATDDLFAMEYIDATKLGKWFRKVNSKTSKKYMRKLMRNALEQCHQLDLRGLDHGELSNPSKHILIRNDSIEPKTVIIDYESASRERHASNLTAVAQFFLLASPRSEKVRRLLPPSGKKSLSKARIISLLHDYKENLDEKSFKRFVEYLGI